MIETHDDFERAILRVLKNGTVRHCDDVVRAVLNWLHIWKNDWDAARGAIHVAKASLVAKGYVMHWETSGWAHWQISPNGQEYLRANDIRFADICKEFERMVKE